MTNQKAITIKITNEDDNYVILDLPKDKNNISDCELTLGIDFDEPETFDVTCVKSIYQTAELQDLIDYSADYRDDFSIDDIIELSERLGKWEGHFTVLDALCEHAELEEILFNVNL